MEVISIIAVMWSVAFLTLCACGQTFLCKKWLVEWMERKKIYENLPDEPDESDESEPLDDLPEEIRSPEDELQCHMCTNCCLVGSSSVAGKPPVKLMKVPINPEPVRERRLTQHEIRRIFKLALHESALMLILPFIPVVAAPWTTCQGGMPTWAYILYLPLLLRLKWIEFTWLRGLGWSYYDFVSLKALDFWLWGVLEHMDVFTDGAMPIQAWQCEPEATQSFAHAFEVTPYGQVWLPLVQWLHLWGLLLLCFTFATLLQQAYAAGADVAGGNGRGMHGTLTALDVAGLQALAKEFLKRSGDGGVAEDAKFAANGVKCWSKVLAENLVQLYLQSALFSVTFERLSEVGRIKLLVSMGLGSASATHKLTSFIIDLSRRAWKAKNWKRGPGLILFTLLFAGLAVIPWIAARLVFTYRCKEHLWNLTSGCVTAH